MPAQPVSKMLASYKLHAGRMLMGAGLTLLVACQTAPVLQPHTTVVTPAVTGALSALEPLSKVGVHYVIHADLSDVRFLVYRAGPLASLGHNHVIQAKTVAGDVYLAPDFTRSGFELNIQLLNLQIDVPEARATEGPDFAVQPSAAAIDGTRKNMLGASELDVANYPGIHIRSVRLVGPASAPIASIRIALHGVERDIDLPLAIAYADKQLTVTGSFDIRQTDFGITPLSILGGGLQVADIVKVRFRIVAEKA